MRIVWEAVLVAIAAIVFGLVGNAANPSRIDLSRDYYAMLRGANPTPRGEVPVTEPPEVSPQPSDEIVDPTPAPTDEGGEVDGVPPSDGEESIHGYTGAAAEAARRMIERGIQVIGHDEVVALYSDEMFEYEAYTFVDARNEEKYRAGHIKNSYLFDHYYMDRYVGTVVPACKGGVTEVIVYCHGEECTDSEIAAQHLLNLGVDPAILKVYVGGIAQWTKGGLPLERGERGSGDMTESKE